MKETWRIAIRTALAATLISVGPSVVPMPWTSWTWTMTPPQTPPDPSRYLEPLERKHETAATPRPDARAAERARRPQATHAS